jgi:glycosyltransferase involved in cell wall biosynthesis
MRANAELNPRLVREQAPAGPLPVAVALSVRNGGRTMPALLDSVEGWASRVLVFDTGSNDGTLELCRARGCDVVECEWAGTYRQRIRCLQECANSAWILLLDSDEIVEPELRDAIAEVVSRNDPRVNGYGIRRTVFFEGAWLRHTFQPEFRTRLVRGDRARVIGSGRSGEGTHERVEVDGPVPRLRGTLRHESWADLHDFWARSSRYCIDAARSGGEGGSVIDVMFRPIVAFTKQYILKRGFLDGRRGFLMAYMLATANLMKQITLLRLRWSASLRVTADRDGSTRAVR